MICGNALLDESEPVGFISAAVLMVVESEPVGSISVIVLLLGESKSVGVCLVCGHDFARPNLSDIGWHIGWQQLVSR
jgi:hypothetical protein